MRMIRVGVLFAIFFVLMSFPLHAQTKMLCVSPIAKGQLVGMTFSGKSHVYDTSRSKNLFVDCGTLCDVTGTRIRTTEGVAHEVILLSGPYSGKACYVFPEWIHNSCSCSK